MGDSSQPRIATSDGAMPRGIAVAIFGIIVGASFIYGGLVLRDMARGLEFRIDMTRGIRDWRTDPDKVERAVSQAEPILGSLQFAGGSQLLASALIILGGIAMLITHGRIVWTLAAGTAWMMLQVVVVLAVLGSYTPFVVIGPAPLLLVMAFLIWRHTSAVSNAHQKARVPARSKPTNVAQTAPRRMGVPRRPAP